MDQAVTDISVVGVILFAIVRDPRVHEDKVRNEGWDQTLQQGGIPVQDKLVRESRLVELVNN